MKGTIVRIQKPAEAVRVLEIKTEQVLDFTAGQYLKMAISDFPAQYYSIASAPSAEPYIEIHTKRGNGPVSQYITDSLQVGESVVIEAVDGDMVLQPVTPDNPRPILFVAGGLGITPIKSMIDDLAAHDFQNCSVHLFWGAVNEEELYLESYFEAMESEYVHFSLHTHVGGTIGDEVISVYKDLSYFDIYIAGKKAMLAATLELFQNHKAREDRMFFDKAVMNMAAASSTAAADAL